MIYKKHLFWGSQLIFLPIRCSRSSLRKTTCVRSFPSELFNVSSYKYMRCNFISFLITDWTYANDRCQTPDGAFGYCIPVRQCRPMLQALQSVRRPLSRSLSLLFNRYSCGQNAQAARVCCPNGPINLQSVYSNRPSPDLSHNSNSTDDC